MNYYTILPLVAILAFLAVNEIDCQCYDIIDQYYSCKHLKMTCYSDIEPLGADTNSTSNCIYVPDSSVPNNKLTDSFYRRLNLNKMNFDEAMDFFKKIYNEIDGCTSDFCRCVNRRWFFDPNYVVYFRNESNFRQVKKIIKSYNEKYRSKLLSADELKYNFPQPNLPTLTKFCIKYDYSNLRLYFYKDVTTKCFKTDYDPNGFYDCEWEVKVVNKSLELNYTNEQRSKLMKCYLLGKSTCPKELLRFYLLSIWSGEAPNLTWTQRSLTSYFDSVIKDAKKYKPKIAFESLTLSSYGQSITIVSYKNGWSMYNQTASKFNETCFSSKQLKINCFWDLSQNNSNQISLMRTDFEFIYDASHSFNRSVNISSLLDGSDSSLTNQTIKDSQGQNWIQFIWTDSTNFLEIYDFISNSHIMLDMYNLYLIAPKDFFKNGSGVFVDGFNNNTSI